MWSNFLDFISLVLLESWGFKTWASPVYLLEPCGFNITLSSQSLKDWDAHLKLDRRRRALEPEWELIITVTDRLALDVGECEL